MRRFQLKAAGTAEAPKDFYFLAAEGQKIEPAGPNAWTVDAALTVRLPDWKGEKAVVRESKGARQLIVPVAFTNGAASFNVEMAW